MRKAIAVVVMVIVLSVPAEAKPLHFLKTKRFWFSAGAVAAASLTGALVAGGSSRGATDYSGAPLRVTPKAKSK